MSPRTPYRCAPHSKKQGLKAIGHGKPLNLIHTPMAFKCDVFPARAFKLGMEELDHPAIYLISATERREIGC